MVKAVSNGYRLKLYCHYLIIGIDNNEQYNEYFTSKSLAFK